MTIRHPFVIFKSILLSTLFVLLCTPLMHGERVEWRYETEDFYFSIFIDAERDNGEWILSDEGEATLNYAIGNPKIIDIPEYVSFQGHSYPVTSTALQPFLNNKNIEVVKLPKSMKSVLGIGANLNHTIKEIIVDPENPYMSSLDGILYDKTYTKILAWPQRKKEIKEWRENLPQTVKTIGKYAFYGYDFYYDNLTINVPEGIEVIEERAYNESNAYHLTLPSTLTSIGEWAFARSCFIECINIPANVSHIALNAFHHILFLESFTVDPTNKYYYSVDNYLIEKTTDRLISVPFATNGIVPNGVKSISSHAYLDSSVENITLPNSVISLEESAFASSSNLRSIVLSENLTTIPDNAFRSCHKLSTINLHNGIDSIGAMAFFGTSISNVDLSHIKAIGNSAFCATHITSFEIPEGITDWDSFITATDSLRICIIPSTISRINQYSFADIKGLEKLFCNATVPPIIYRSGASEWMFINADDVLNNTTLIVPEGTKEIYRQAEGWKDFRHIQEPDENASINTCNRDNISIINATPGALTISTPYDNEIELWNLKGNLIAKSNGNLSVQSIHPGFYIVKLESESRKIYVK